jgi:hypothetical protein
MKRLPILGALVLFCLPVFADTPSACNAASINIVANCGFETGQLPPWTANAGPATIIDTVENAHTGLFAPHSGHNYLQIIYPPQVSYPYPLIMVINNLETVAGPDPINMHVSWDLIAKGGGFFCGTVNVAQVPSDFPATCGSLNQSADWQQFDLDTTVDPGTLYLQFNFFPRPGTVIGLDDVVITPEPGRSLWLLLIVTVAGLAIHSRRRASHNDAGARMD